MYLVHAMIGGRGFLRFVLIAITKMDILYMFYHFQDPIKVIRRYEGCHYTRLESYYIIFYFETDWSRIRPLPSTTLRFQNKLSVKTFRPNNYTPGWVWLPKNTEWNQIVCSKKLARLETDWSSIRPRKRLQP